MGAAGAPIARMQRCWLLLLSCLRSTVVVGQYGDAPYYVGGIFQYNAQRASNVNPPGGSRCLHTQWTEAECFTGASGSAHSEIRPGWAPIFDASMCLEQMGQVRYDDNNQRFIAGGECDYVCGYCEHPCSSRSEISNLAVIAVDKSEYIFGCNACARGTMDLDGDSFTPCVPCVDGQYATVPNGTICL